MNTAIAKTQNLTYKLNSFVHEKAFIFSLKVFLLSRIIYVIAWAADMLIADVTSTRNIWYISPYSFLDSWCRWDSQWYLVIASHGYSFDINSFAFIPLYPLTIHVLSSIFGHPELMGLLISNISLFTALYFLYKLIELKWPAQIAKNTLIYLMIFPAAFFFSAIYTESLFFMLVVLSFYFSEKRNYLLAGIFGAFASVTRIMGLILIPCILAKYLKERKWDWRKIDRNILYVALIPIGLLGYMLYQYISVGDPLAFVSAQSSYQFTRHFTIPLLPIYKSLASLITEPFYSTHLINAYSAIGFIVILIVSWKKMPLEYNIYSALSLFIPLCTISRIDPLLSFSRFVLVIFPVFISMGMWNLKPLYKWLFIFILVSSQLILLADFVNWYWIA
jgi:hypothetical protein